ncbi:MAG TPA: toxin [Candidatus Woesebacteria bacterium]|nr:toxin [Candidatus Woesebacteria bacterium]
MKYFDWSEQKNIELKTERGVTFEEVVISINEGGLLAVLRHHNPERYGLQKIMLVILEGYVYLVPCVEDGEKCFLKTIIPSRKASKEFLLR